MTREVEQIVPIGERALIQREQGERQSRGIIVPNEFGELVPGIVVALPAASEEASIAAMGGFTVGDKVLFPKKLLDETTVGADRYLVPVGAIAAVVESSGVEHSEPEKNDFFLLPSWADFWESDAAYKAWSEWENVKDFHFRIRFLEPFRSILPLARRIYEHCVEELKPCVGDNFSAFELELLEKTQNQLQDQSMFVVKCQDDYWDGAIVLSGKDRFLEFVKRGTDWKTLIETLPAWMRVCHRVLTDPIFRPILGDGGNRVTLVAVIVQQVIQLVGKGKRAPSVHNSESMGHFIRFGITEGEAGMSAALQQLGIAEPLESSIGRVDLDLGFRKKIGGQNFEVWFNPQAPGNENARQLHVRWEVQDQYPRRVSEKKYGMIMTEFFRDVVLKRFYDTWFANMECKTLR